MVGAVWGNRETFVAIVVTNIPVVFQLFKRWILPACDRILHSIGYSRRTGNGSTLYFKDKTLATQARMARRSADGAANRASDSTTELKLSEDNIVAATDADRKPLRKKESWIQIMSGPKASLDNIPLGVIQRQVEVSVCEERIDMQSRSGSVVDPGNYVSTTSTRNGSLVESTPIRSSYLVDHIHQDRYRKV